MHKCFHAGSPLKSMTGDWLHGPASALHNVDPSGCDAQIGTQSVSILIYTSVPHRCALWNRCGSLCSQQRVVDFNKLPAHPCIEHLRMPGGCSSPSLKGMDRYARVNEPLR